MTIAMLKFNWGTKIALVYSAFVLLMLGLVFAASRVDFQLVTKDYYQQELDYENRITEMKQLAMLDEPLQIMAQDEKLRIVFPSQALPEAGSVHLYRPSNQQYDQHFELKEEASPAFEIDTANLPRGLWRLKIRWKANGKYFYTEKVWVKGE
ncbi:MAG: hypothetical protein D6730_24760 [Bacteroidetes bacterium]|nr:MAG: hypothetical protein D6730_24760 [Bacteroidota bacterium]